MGQHRVVFADDTDRPDWQLCDLNVQILVNFNRKFFGKEMILSSQIPERTRILKEEVSKYGGVAKVADKMHGMIVSLDFDREADLSAFLLKWS